MKMTQLSQLVYHYNLYFCVLYYVSLSFCILYLCISNRYLLHNSEPRVLTSRPKNYVHKIL